MLKELTRADVMKIAKQAEEIYEAQQNEKHGLRRDLIEQLDRLDRPALSEFVALMWIGRGDVNPADWRQMVARADADQGDLASYLTDKAPLAEYLRNGLAILDSLKSENAGQDSSQS